MSSPQPATSLQPQPASGLMLAVAWVQFVICSSGFVMNAILALVIAKNRQLRPGSCGLLIMWMAIFDLLAEFSLFSTPFVLTVTGLTIPLMTCWYIQSYGPCVNTQAQWMMLLISVDRLYSMVWPIHYKTTMLQRKNKYLAIIILTPFIATIVALQWGYYNVVTANPDKQVFCQPSDLMSGGVAIGVIISSWLNIGTFAVYFLMYFFVKIKLLGTSQSHFDARLFRSLTVIMAIQFLFWLPASGIGPFTLTLLGYSSFLVQPGWRMVLQVAKVGQAINLPVLYTCSAEHRKAIRKELSSVFGICRTSVGPSEQQQTALVSNPAAISTTNPLPLNNNFV